MDGRDVATVMRLLVDGPLGNLANAETLFSLSLSLSGVDVWPA